MQLAMEYIPWFHWNELKCRCKSEKAVRKTRSHKDAFCFRRHHCQVVWVCGQQLAPTSGTVSIQRFTHAPVAVPLLFCKPSSGSDFNLLSSLPATTQNCWLLNYSPCKEHSLPRNVYSRLQLQRDRTFLSIFRSLLCDYECITTLSSYT